MRQRLLVAAVLFYFFAGCGGPPPAKNGGKGSEPGVLAALRWDEENTQKPLSITDEGTKLSFDTDSKAQWLGSQTTARLSNGVFTWDFKIENIADRQIGVGILLDPPDWGFFGYLGSGKNAWSYDAYEGAIVTEEEATHKGLPKIAKSGTVSVRLDLKTKNECVFIVDGKETPAVKLPAGAVVIPAACLLKKGQVVIVANLQRAE